MTKISLLGIPHDENSSYMRGAAEAPAPIRRELQSDAYSQWSETGVDLGTAGRIVDHGDLQFDSSCGITATVAAKLLKEIAGMMVKTRG